MAYFDIDLKEHILTDLEDISERLTRQYKHPAGLKWVILAADSALYHSMIMVLKNTDLSGVWKIPEPRNAAGDINPFDAKAFLIGFHDALKAVQDASKMSGYVGAKPLSIAAADVEKLKEYHENRNSIVHHGPVSWSIHVLVAMEHALAVLPVIEFLLLQSGRVGLIEGEVSRLKGAIQRIRATIAANPEYQEMQRQAAKVPPV